MFLSSFWLLIGVSGGPQICPQLAQKSLFWKIMTNRVQLTIVYNRDKSCRIINNRVQLININNYNYKSCRIICTSLDTSVWGCPRKCNDVYMCASVWRICIFVILLMSKCKRNIYILLSVHKSESSLGIDCPQSQGNHRYIGVEDGRNTPSRYEH